MNWCILIPAIVGLICAILGYLIGRLFRKDTDDIDRYIRENAKLESDLKVCEQKLTTAKAVVEPKTTPKVSKSTPVDTKSSSIVAPKSTVIAASSFDVAAAKTVFGKKIKQDDLKVVEGIGPKIEQLFHNHNVTTWKALSECSIDKCQNVLNSGGDRYKMHNPGTWPKQAKLAYEGQWKALKEWQDTLYGGR